jgi:segregation and condensation protein B
MIALKGPIPQSDLVELRGSGVYQQVPELVEQGFISKRRQANGRSFSLQVTERFYQYFQLDRSQLERLSATALSRKMSSLAIEEPEAIQLETGDVTPEIDDLPEVEES